VVAAIDVTTYFTNICNDPRVVRYYREGQSLLILDALTTHPLAWDVLLSLLGVSLVGMTIGLMTVLRRL
jgi:hypothetical protein